MKTFAKRWLLGAALCLAIAVTLCSCSSKRALSMDEFMKKAESVNCITDAAFVDMRGVTQARHAVKLDRDDMVLWTAEFDIFENRDLAKSGFEDKRQDFDIASSDETYYVANSYETYENIGGGKYQYLSRVGATLLYVNVDEKYTDEAKELIKAMGY